MPDLPLTFSVMLRPSGQVFPAAPDTPLLRAATAAGVALPSSCRNGTCRACMCRMTSGRVTYRIERPGLSTDEIAEGYILPCVAHAGADLVLEAPDAAPLETRPERPIRTGPYR